VSSYTKSALAPDDRADLAWFFQTYRDQMLPYIPDAVPLREHAALLASLLLRHTACGSAVIGQYLQTATDVLRLAVALSDGDLSLATATRFRNFTRPERRLLLGLLEDCNNCVEDMLRYPEPWKRLGERLHPGTYQARFPRSAAAFDVIRNDRPFPTFRSQVEGALRTGDVPAALELLQHRPGELARRLDHLLRLDGQPDAVITVFSQCAAAVSTPVLLQVLAHFVHRPVPRPLRVVFPKGEVPGYGILAHGSDVRWRRAGV
jgi:hypothetical protein